MKNLQLLIIPLLVFISCEETEETDVDLGDYHLFTASFEEGEFADDVTSFIFISDGDGNVLADSGFIGAASFELFADTSLSPPPDTISVTTVTKEGENFEIVTNLGIDKGSEWTWYNPYYGPEVIGQSYYTFTNLPDDLFRVIISSNGRSRSAYNDYDTYELSHYESLEDVLIMGLLNDGSAIYKIVQGVSVGETHSVDFSGFSVANQIIMNNNSDLNCDYSRFYGYDSNDSFIAYKRHRLNYSGGEGINWDSNQNFIFNYPPEFGKFRTQAYVGDPNGTAGGKNWYQITTGEIPQTFEKIDADISVINSEINNFEMNLTGTFDQWEMELRRSRDTGDIDFWYVFVNPSINNGKLPSFPTSISNEYPELLRQDFIMNNVAVTDYLCAQNQEEWHELFFNTDGYYLDFCSGYRKLRHWPD